MPCKIPSLNNGIHITWRTHRLRAIPDEPLLRMRGIHKSFPGVRAIRDVSLDLEAGEVLALLGENGAGKSTLIKILGGAQLPDQGEIAIAGRLVSLANPVAAQLAGIGIIYQEFNLVPAMTAQENLFLGQERATLGIVHQAQERRVTAELFERIGVPVPSRRVVSRSDRGTAAGR